MKMKDEKALREEEKKFRATEKDFTRLLGNLFNGQTKAILRKQEERKENLPKDPLNYKGNTVHFFPENPKAPYLTGREVPCAHHGINMQYTANFIMDLEADKNGQRECSEESLVDRMYIALMARTKIRLQNTPHTLEQALAVLEDAVAPGIAKRYGWSEVYARGLLQTCANAMAEGFSIQSGLLLKQYEILLAKNGNGNGNGKNSHKTGGNGRI